MTTYVATCLDCPWRHEGHGTQTAAEKHTKAARHVTTTHVAGGAFARWRAA